MKVEETVPVKATHTKLKRSNQELGRLWAHEEASGEVQRLGVEKYARSLSVAQSANRGCSCVFTRGPAFELYDFPRFRRSESA